MKNKTILFFIVFVLSSLLFNQPAYAEVSPDLVSQIVLKFNEQSDKWYNIVLEVTRSIFYYMLVLEFAWIGIQAVLGNSDIKETFKQFIIAVVAAGFFLAIINNYQEWTNNLIMGLQTLAGEMTTLHRDSDNPFMIGLELFDYLIGKNDELGWGEYFLAVLVAIVVLMCFTLITAKIILIKCEVIIASVAALILVAFGATKFLREYAVNTLRYILSVAFKLFVMQLVIGVGFSFFTDITNEEFGMPEFGIILGFVIVLTVISMSLPETVANIINGSHTGSGTQLASTMGAISSMVGASAVGAVGGGVAVSRATSIAKEQGASGFSEVARGTFSAMKEARQQGQMNKTSMGLQLRDNLNVIREINKQAK